MKFPITESLRKTILAALLALVMLFFGLHFLMEEGVHVNQIYNALVLCDRLWLLAGLLLSLVYIGLHSEMYVQSFKSLGLTVDRGEMTRLYLKRNLISVVLPAGFLSSQAFFGASIARSQKVHTNDVLSASGIFSTAGLLSMVVVVLPALGWMLTQNILPGGAVAAFVVVSVLLSSLVWAIVNFVQQGIVYRNCKHYLPAFTARLDELDWSRFQIRYFLYVLLLSCLVEVVGVLHVYIAVRALGESASFSMVFASYIAVLIVLMTSPFLRGVGAVEALLAFVLMHFGLSAVEAVSTAILFRFFEFWIVLLLSVPVFVFRPGSLVVRIAPAVLLLLLGIVNILSGITPSIAERTKLLSNYLPLATSHASAALTVAIGIVLLATAYYLLKGLRNAWWLALVLSAVSLVSHLIKGFDYEESTLALLVISALLYQRNQYNVHTNINAIRNSWVPALMIVLTCLLLSSYGFWLLDHVHFGADFTWYESFIYACQSFILIDPAGLHPLTAFGHDFLILIHLLGGFSMIFLAFMALIPIFPKFQNDENALEKATQLAKTYGKSPLDYFKTYHDKQFFFPQSGQSFVAYKNTARYALVLENPVAPDEATMIDSVVEFDQFCNNNGMRSIYYRIPESSAALYRSLGKHLLPLGQEAIVNLNTFSMDGKEKKSLRNALNKIEREGYQFVVHEAPLNSRILQQLHAVSNEWLQMLHRTELSFSQGVFDEKEIKNQTVLTLENKDGKILSFLNLIPGGSEQEANFDLMRRTEDAPNGSMDFMFANMFLYCKSKGYASCNLGLVPMSGLEHPTNVSENIIKLAYEHIPRFSGYKSLRFFKEKFEPIWETKYVAYESQLDIINLPVALDRVVRQKIPSNWIQP
jgi:phosphatidylglycerol lysyltransferase